MTYSHMGLVRAIIDQLPPFDVTDQALDQSGQIHNFIRPAGYIEKRQVAEQVAITAEEIIKRNGTFP
jgi:hypothetical protein